MAGTQNLWLFIVSGLLLNIMPGPDSLFIMARSATQGWRAGFVATSGIGTGVWVHILAAALGLSALLATSAAAFTVIKIAGAAYLVWIGIGMLRSAGVGQGPADSLPMSRRAHARRALAVSLTNPKVVLFFMAFFPLFLRPGARPLTLGLMMVHVTLISFLYQFGLVLLGNALARRLARIPAVRAVGTRLAGLALVGFGIRLALDNR